MTSYTDLIAQAARSGGTTTPVVMKDHVLSYVIACIAQDELLADRLIFKGGTAIRKCYIADYRYSEDLDYTVRDGGRLQASELQASLARLAAAIPEQFPNYEPGLVVEGTRVMPSREDHPFGQLQGRITLRTPTRAAIGVKLEITGSEPIIDAIASRPLLHGYLEELNAIVPSYTLEEIAAEKMRTFLQVRQRLADTGASGRAPYIHRARDVYDIAQLRQRGIVDWSRVREILPSKGQARNVAFTSAADFLDPRIRREHAALWDVTVLPLARPRIHFDDAWRELEGAADDMVSHRTNGLRAGDIAGEEHEV